MYKQEDEVMPGERIGEKRGNEEPGEYAEVWDGAMADAPEFAGEWGYGEQNGGPGEGAPENATLGEAEGMLSPEVNEASELSGASKLTSYGFDTASRMYGLGTVLKAIEETDETGRDAENPLGAVYERMVPNKQERVFLFWQIQKDLVRDNQYNDDTELYENSRLGLSRSGEFYDWAAVKDDTMPESAQAIRALKRLLEILETDERFADLREQARAEGKTIVEYLVRDEANPTLSHFFNQAGAELSESDVEEIAEEIAAESEEKAAEEKATEDGTVAEAEAIF